MYTLKGFTEYMLEYRDLAFFNISLGYLSIETCLSPKILSNEIAYEVVERSSVNAFITWNPPNIDLRKECVGVVTSLPPLMYTVQVIHNGEIIQQQVRVIMKYISATLI